MTRLAWVPALALACGAQQPVPEDMSVRPGKEAAPEVREAGEGCDVAGATLGGAAWLPGDARLAVIVDLDEPELDAAVARLAAVGARGLPVVASLALTNLGLQLSLIRRQLGRAGLQPRELALVHDRAGAVVWVLRARCDLRDLQRTLARAWGVRGRAVAGGEVAEPPAGHGFPHDVVFLAEDRVALVPAGQATAQRRWLEDRAAPPIQPAGSEVPPGTRLDEIPAAPIRGVVTGTSLLAADVADAPPPVRTIRVTAAALEIDGRP